MNGLILKLRLWAALVLGLLVGGDIGRANEAVWQWAVPFGGGRAFLWLPQDCVQVRGVVVAQHNMIEQGILEHAAMRRTLGELGFAAVFIAPPFDRPFQFDRGAGERFDALMRALADVSGYGELAVAPVVPMGHSACASFPWNFAAWNPARTLAVLSLKGDAPQTNLTGSGAQNPAWAGRRIEGIPGLMVMSEGEWWEDRLAPLLAFRVAQPGAPLAVLCDTGHGHFDARDELVTYLALFLRKAAMARLPAKPGDALRAVDPAQGWVTGRWRPGDRALIAAQPAAAFRGDPAEVFWGFDEEIARATEAHHARGRGQKSQQVDFVQEEKLVPITTTHAGVTLRFLPEADGLTFRLGGAFITPLPPKPPVAAKDKAPPPTTTVPVLAAPGTHAAGPVEVSVIVGPAERVAPGRFRVAIDRTFVAGDARSYDIWWLARHAGGDGYKGAVQQGLLKLPRFTAGAAQTILFPAINDQPVGRGVLALGATSSAGLPVIYAVREGPAFVRDGELHFTALPPRTKFPVNVTVVAWQPGRGSEPRVRAAEPVEISFQLLAP